MGADRASGECNGWMIICFEWRILFGLIESPADLVSIPRHLANDRGRTCRPRRVDFSSGPIRAGSDVIDGLAFLQLLHENPSTQWDGDGAS